MVNSKICSVAEAARHFGIKPHYISSAIHRCGTTKKLIFFIEYYEDN